MDRRTPPGRGRGIPPPAGKYSAAQSHTMNDKYMDDFEKAWEELNGLQVGSGGARSSGAGAAAVGRSPYPVSGSSLAAQQRSVYAALEEPSTSAPAGVAYGARPVARATGASPARGSPAARAAAARATTSSSSPTPSGGLRRVGGGSSPGIAPPPLAPRASGPAPPNPRYPPRVCSGWQTGPVDSAGVLIDLSDRPSACSAADWSRNEVVIGSTDHALYVVDAAKGLRKRQLYSKTCGHSEWVTSVTYCGDGRIVSGGMDSKLWVWPAGGARGVVAEAHFGPISQVKYDSSSGLVASASYDKTIRLWSLGGVGASEAGCLSGHEAPVLEMELGGEGRIVSGDRSGHVLLWDTSAAGLSWRMKSVHAGHVTALAWFGGAGGEPHAGCFASGGQDGAVRVWDPRTKTNVTKVLLHVNAQGHGAVGDIVAGGPAAAGMIVTAGADGTLRTLDPRAGFKPAVNVQLTDFPYSMTVAGGLAVVGCGDGSVHFIDIQSGHRLYALGSNRAAVRCLEASSDRLVASGDDGKAILYNFG